jgi:hypothetical protein
LSDSETLLTPTADVADIKGSSFTFWAAATTGSGPSFSINRESVKGLR